MSIWNATTHPVWRVTDRTELGYSARILVMGRFKEEVYAVIFVVEVMRPRPELL